VLRAPGRPRACLLAARSRQGLRRGPPRSAQRAPAHRQARGPRRLPAACWARRRRPARPPTAPPLRRAPAPPRCRCHHALQSPIAARRCIRGRAAGRPRPQRPACRPRGARPRQRRNGARAARRPAHGAARGRRQGWGPAAAAAARGGCAAARPTGARALPGAPPRRGRPRRRPPPPPGRRWRGTSGRRRWPAAAAARVRAAPALTAGCQVPSAACQRHTCEPSVARRVTAGRRLDCSCAGVRRRARPEATEGGRGAP
jgi:hypothetical protein